MLISSRVEEVVVTLVDEHYDKAIARLAMEGIFHIDSPPSGFKGSIDREHVRTLSLASEYTSKLESFFKALGLEPETVEGVTIQVSRWVDGFNKVVEEYKDLHEEYERGISRLLQIETQLSELQALRAVLSQVKHIDVDVRAAIDATRLSFTAGFVDAEAEERLEDYAKKYNVVIAFEKIDEEKGLVAVAGDYPSVRSVTSQLTRYKWSPLSIPTNLPGSPAKAFEAVSREIQRLIGEADNIRSRLSRSEMISQLKEYYTKVLAFREIFKFLVNTVRTRTTRTFRGFVDVADRSRLERVLKEATGGAFIMASLGVKRASGKTPTKVRLPGPLRVFHNIVRMYGEPDPDEIVPTLFLAITLPLTFALMFPDAGHGLLVLLFGLLYVMPRNRDWGTVIAILGASSIISGLLAGEVFGPLVSKAIGIHKFWESLGFETPPLAPPTLASELYPPGPERVELSVTLLYKSISIALWIGGFMLTLGALLGVVDALLKGDKMGAILIKAPKLLFFAAVTSPFLVYFNISESGAVLRSALLEGNLGNPVAAFLYYGAIAGLLWLFIGNIVESVMHKESPLAGLGHGFLEVYESILMAVGNIPSFLRIMALSLAHASLMLGFTELYYVVAGGGVLGLLVGVLIYLLGNLLAAGLEGILAYAHSIRLHFYEWFSKFYSGTGVPFQPISLPGVRIVVA